MQNENFRVILSYILKNVFLPSFFSELDKLKKCRFCTTFKNMCQWRKEDEKQREEMTCITKKYPMKEQFIELGRRLFCVCHVKWRKTFCFDHKRVERKAGKECCEWESKFNKHRQTYQFNWIKFNNYSWWCYQKESSPFFPFNYVWLFYIDAKVHKTEVLRVEIVYAHLMLSSQSEWKQKKTFPFGTATPQS